MAAWNDLARCTGFEWDEGNRDKNWQKHRVSDAECEEIFFNEPLVVADDPSHSSSERRYYALGITNVGRPLFVSFTIRGLSIRVISARNMTKREERRYGAA